MATASVQPKTKQEPVGKKIPLCTFLKWNMEEVFDYKTEIIDGMTCGENILQNVRSKKALLDYTSRAFRNALLVLA